MLRLERRKSASQAWALATPLLALVMTMLAGAIMFWMLGKPPLESIKTIFWSPLFDEQFASYSRPQILVKAAPLILIAIGLAMGFRAGIWNIGAEGQYIMGALCGGAIALAVYPHENRFLFPLMVFGGLFGGFLWAMIPAILKTRFNTNEILVSLLLVYVAQNILAQMSLGLLRNPDGGGFPGSRNLSQYPSAANLELISGTGAHWGVLSAIFVVVAAQVLFTRHMLGYSVQVTGQAPRAAGFGGINTRRLTIICLGASGALAGVAGLFEVAGPSGRISIDFNVGYGFTAIIVAFLGRLHPVGIVFAGLLMALTYIGGELAQFTLNIPGAAINAFQGMLLFFLLTLDVFTHYRLSWMRTSAP